MLDAWHWKSQARIHILASELRRSPFARVSSSRPLQHLTRFARGHSVGSCWRALWFQLHLSLPCVLAGGLFLAHHCTPTDLEPTDGARPPSSKASRPGIHNSFPLEPWSGHTLGQRYDGCLTGLGCSCSRKEGSLVLPPGSWAWSKGLPSVPTTQEMGLGHTALQEDNLGWTFLSHGSSIQETLDLSHRALLDFVRRLNF